MMICRFHGTNRSQQLGYCSLNRIYSFESKKKLKELDSQTMPEIQSQLTAHGLCSDILDAPVISKVAWKNTLSLPKGRDFSNAILKRAGVGLEKKKASKRQKKAVVAEEEDMVIDVVEDKDVEMEEPQDPSNEDKAPSTHTPDVEMNNDEASQGQGALSPANDQGTPEPPSCGQPQRK